MEKPATNSSEQELAHVRSMPAVMDDIQLVQAGLGIGPEVDKKAAQGMSGKTFSLIIDLHQGDHQDGMTTCDLTHEYVTINADYRT